MERPTVEEARELRTVLNRCKSITPEFDLTGGLDGGVWGTATIALLAVELDDVEFLNELVAEGHAASGLPNSLGATTLYFAANRRADSALIWALEKGVNPNQADVDGNTPLMMAAQHRANARMIEALIARGANVDAFAERGWTALAIAIRKENFANGALLVAAGADPELAKEFLIELTATSTNEEAQAEIADLIAAFELYLENQ